MPHAMRLLYSVLISLGTLALQLSIWQHLDPFAWVLYYPAVIVSALLAGASGGIATSALLTCSIYYAFLPPRFSLEFENPAHLYLSFSVAITGIVLSLMIDRMRKMSIKLAVQGSDFRFRRAMEEAPIPVMIHANDGSIVLLSRAWTEISGYSVRDIPTIGDWTAKAFGDERKAEIYRKIADIYDITVRKPGGTHRIRCIDGGERVWDFWSVGLGMGEDGRTFAIIMAMDVTERQRTEEKLKKTSDVLAESQKIAHTGSFEYVAESQSTEWSEEEYRIYGLDPKVPSPNYHDMLKQCIHPDDAPKLDSAFMAAFQNSSIYELEHRIVLPDGNIRWVYDRAYPYFDEEGKLLRTWACTEFCVNGLLAGNCRIVWRHNEREETCSP